MKIMEQWHPITGSHLGYIREKMKGTHWAESAKKNSAILDGEDPDDPLAIRFWNNQINWPESESGGKLIWVCDHADPYEDSIPDKWIERILKVIKSTPQHRYFIVTGNVKRATTFDVPENLWLGLRLREQNDARWMKYLRRLSHRRKFVYYGPIERGTVNIYVNRMDWIIISDRGNRKPHMLNDIISEARSRSVPVWIKNPETRFESIQEVPRELQDFVER